MYIYQLHRALLSKNIKRYAKYITGRTLDVGSGGFSRYSKMFNTNEYVRLDARPGKDIDVVALADAMPFPDNDFDSIVCTQVLEHVSNPDAVMREIARVLRVGGRALITVPQMNELHDEPNDYWRYTCYGMDELATRHGFKVLRSSQLGGFYCTREQMRMRYLIDTYQLHDRPIPGHLASILFSIRGRIAVWRDGRDDTRENRRHTIGWCFLLESINEMV